MTKTEPSDKASKFQKVLFWTFFLLGIVDWIGDVIFVSSGILNTRSLVAIGNYSIKAEAVPTNALNLRGPVALSFKSISMNLSLYSGDHYNYFIPSSGISNSSSHDPQWRFEVRYEAKKTISAESAPLVGFLNYGASDNAGIYSLQDITTFIFLIEPLGALTESRTSLSPSSAGSSSNCNFTQGVCSRSYPVVSQKTFSDYDSLVRTMGVIIVKEVYVTAFVGYHLFKGLDRCLKDVCSSSFLAFVVFIISLFRRHGYIDWTLVDNPKSKFYPPIMILWNVLKLLQSISAMGTIYEGEIKTSFLLGLNIPITTILKFALSAFSTLMGLKDVALHIYGYYIFCKPVKVISVEEK